MKQAGTAEPGLPARRGGQARRLVPGRSGRRAARGARPGAERLVHRPLSRRAVRPERGAVHRHRELPPEHPGAAARPHGDGGVHGLHRAREAGDRAAVPGSAAARGERPQRRASSRSTDGALCRRSSPGTPARRASASWSASWASWPARSRRRIAAKEADRVSVDTGDGRTTCSAGPRVHPERAARGGQVGVATGMYYTPDGRRHHVRRGLDHARARENWS